MEAILSWVKSGLLFGIFASVILMICPNKSYMKHIGMVVGLLFISVMIHPLMEFFQVDSSTYADYIKNFLMVDTGNNEISDSNLELYEESVKAQLKTVLKENGYSFEEVSVDADKEGNIVKVELSVGENIGNIEPVEKYLKSLFGEDVKICYGSG